MKKTIAAICFCLGLLLTACSGNSGATAEIPATTAENPAATTETHTATAAKPATTAATLPVPTETLPTDTTAADTTPVVTAAETTPADTPEQTTALLTTPAAPTETTEEPYEETTEAPIETSPEATTTGTEPQPFTRTPGEEETFSEGEDTPIRVTAFTHYPGARAACFPQEGDRVAVISPSTLPTRAETDAVIRGLQSWGYVPVEGQYVCAEMRTYEDCRADLLWALTDPSIKAIFCVRGGYGASEVMDSIAPDTVRAAGKLLIGYSDVTVLHAAWSAAGLPSIHSSMSRVFTGLPEECARFTRQMMRGQLPVYECGGSGYDVPGTAEGVLIGGNLATLTAVLDTEYDCTALQQPYILFIEELEEDLEHIHRFLTVLKHRGVLDNAAGIIFGEWIDIPAESETTDGTSRGGEYQGVADMIRRAFFPDSDIPIAFGFPAGHGDVNYPLLLGEKVRLQVSEDGFTLEWTD
nr:LD-carboxypeptidase [Lachnospiraceae bacterium]